LAADLRTIVEWGGRSGGRGRDPYLMKAKAAGTDAKGLAYKKGEEVLYYPNDKLILAGANKDKAWREFQAARDDEAFMGGGY
jgi:hypothetical protein